MKVRLKKESLMTLKADPLIFNNPCIVKQYADMAYDDGMFRMFFIFRVTMEKIAKAASYDIVDDADMAIIKQLLQADDVDMYVFSERFATEQ